MATLRISSSQLRLVSAGYAAPPPAMFDAIWKWAKPRLESLKYMEDAMKVFRRIGDTEKKLRAVGDPGGDPDRSIRREVLLRLLDNLKREYLRLMDLSAGHGWKVVEEIFPIDLDGWKYADVVGRASAGRKSEANERYGRVSVKFVKTVGEESHGMWYPDNSQILVWVNPGQEDMVSYSAEILRHELAHWAQMYMEIILGGSKFGFPPKDMRDPGIEQRPSSDVVEQLGMGDVHENVFHSLDDYEFQPQGKMVLEWIRQKLALVAPADRREALAAYLAITDSHKYFAYPFVATLKKYSPGKWRRFVNEVLKALV